MVGECCREIKTKSAGLLMSEQGAKEGWGSRWVKINLKETSHLLQASGGQKRRGSQRRPRKLGVFGAQKEEKNERGRGKPRKSLNADGKGANKVRGSQGGGKIVGNMGV